MQTSLGEIAKQAKLNKDKRFTNLHHIIDAEFLTDSFKRLNKKAAAGIDGVTAKEYAKDLYYNVEKLEQRVKTGKYRARIIRRKHIKKPNGKLRPLGIPVIEDKILQAAVGRILNAIYEQDFLATSYGYGPKRGAKEAIHALTDQIKGKYSYVVEADIKGFFDHLHHEWLMKMLDLRIGDGVIKRLIRKWLKAKILQEDGTTVEPEDGTPQGSVISPILANIYLHYVLDLWFEKVVKKHCEGDAYLIRYADDFVAIFRYKKDAEKYYRTLGKRLGKFNLELAEDKTRIISFSRFRKYENTNFCFLGIEFRWGISHKGKDVIKRNTDRSKLKKSFGEITKWCKENRNLRIAKQAEMMKLKLQGHYNYYGIAGNYKSIEQFFNGVMRIWYKWLNRRSQRRSFNWKEFNDKIKYYEIPRPKIMEQWWINQSTQNA